MPLIRKPPGAPAAAPPAPDTASVLAALAGGTEDERWAAARSAAGLPFGAAALAEALPREQSARVREAMFTSLARIGTRDAVEAVLPYLRSDDSNLRNQALGALEAMKGAAWPLLPDLLSDRDADVRILACELARQMPEAQAVELFCKLLDSEPEPNVCASAIEVLADIGTAAALPSLERCGERFRSTPFMAFSIKTAGDRIRARTPEPRA